MYASANLLLEAASRGVRTERLAFSFKFPQADYVPFRALADLFVDNRAYNAHTTGADTLWAGVPAVLPQSRHLAGRAATSFASALGAAHMVAPSWRSYEDAIAELGRRRNQARLWKLRRELQRRTHRALFDLTRLAEGQHRLAAPWAVHASGRAPMHVIAARPRSNDHEAGAGEGGRSTSRYRTV